MGLTIDDIAKAAGVSTATVSRVMNKNYPVSQPTRKRVQSAIERLGYKPNVFARGLMNAHTDAVGIIVPFISNPYHTQIVDAMENELSKKDIFIYLCCTYDDLAVEREYVQRLISRNVDVLIVVEGHSLNTRHNIYLDMKTTQPVILVNEHLALDTHHHIVRCAQEPGFIEAMELLVRRGRRKIALFRGGTSYSFQLKERLFKQFCRDHGPAVGPGQIIRIRKANETSAVHEAADAVTELLRGPSPPDAILAGNDLIAIGVLQGALATGARIPDDLAVIGVDNTIIADISSPRLTTVDLRMEQVGRLTTDLYFQLKDSGFQPTAPQRKTIDSALIERQTT